jgi:hypothetical protein
LPDRAGFQELERELIVIVGRRVVGDRDDRCALVIVVGVDRRNRGLGRRCSAYDDAGALIALDVVRERFDGLPALECRDQILYPRKRARQVGRSVVGGTDDDESFAARSCRLHAELPV